MTDVEGFGTRVREAIARCRENVTALEREPADGVPATLERFDRMFAPLNGLAGRVGLFIQVHPDAGMRAACEELEQEVAALRTDVSLDRELYDRLVALDPKEAESPQERRLLEHGLRDFRRAGVDRDDEVRARVKELQEELVRIGQEFARNTREDEREIILDSLADLEGLPGDWIEKHSPGADGKIHVSTRYPDYFPFMTYARSADARRDLYRRFRSRGHPKNAEVLQRLLTRRYELAQLLGYPNWAAYITEDKMIETPVNAQSFIDNFRRYAAGEPLLHVVDKSAGY